LNNMEREIIIGRQYTSEIGSSDDLELLRDNMEYNKKHIVEHITKCRNRTIRTSDFFNNIKSNLIINNQILPTGCKYFETFRSGRKILIIEEAPMVRTIRASIDMNPFIEKLRLTGKLKEYGFEEYAKKYKYYGYEGPASSFQLSFPYIVFIICLNKNNEFVSIQPYFRLHPITSLLDYLFKAPLYNIPGSQHMCLGGGIETFSNIFDAVENIIEVFWMNIYNNDYTQNIQEYNLSEAFEVQDFLTWMYFTKIDPMFIYNVKWIQYKKNIFETIEHLKNQYINSDEINNSFEIIRNSLKTASSSMLTHQTKFTNNANSIVIKSDLLSVGDEILFKEKKFYLYSIVGNEKEITNIELEDVDDEIISIPFNEFSANYSSIYKVNRLESVIVNGKVIKPESIISCKLSNSDCVIYKKIESLRLGRDGKIEAKIGSDNYLLENLDFEVINFDELYINDVLLVKGNEYLYNNNHRQNMYLSYKLIFESVTVNSRGTIILNFVFSHDSRTKSIKYDDLLDNNIEQFIYNLTDLKIPTVICNFDTLYMNNKKLFNDGVDIIKNKGISIDFRYNFNDFLIQSKDRDEFLDNILFNNKTRLYISNPYNDIDFKVGDPIVYANWDNPEDMLTVSTIDKFEYDDNDKILYVCSTSLNKNSSFRIPFINLIRSKVNVGIIRKVSSHCGGWNSGDKIKANIVGIPNFPKKDSNSIIAFINDGTKYPMALCSNLCTLWMNEDTMAKFTVHPLKSVSWKKIKNSPIELDKIKWQSGDYFTQSNRSYNKIYFLTNKPRYNCFNYGFMDFDGSLNDYTHLSINELSKTYQRYGILIPRFSNININLINAFPNYLGGFIKNNNSYIRFITEQFMEDF